VCPISVFGWFLARALAVVFGVSMWESPDGYVRILLIRNHELHEYVPPWLAYLYNSVSVLMIISIALVVIHWIVTDDRPQS
jgi:hypothetical protein